MFPLTSRTRTAFALAAACAATLGVVGTASAATVEYDQPNDRVIVRDKDGAANRLTARYVDGTATARVSVRDTTTRPTAIGPDCSYDAMTRAVTCTHASAVVVLAGDGDDVVAMDPSLDGFADGGAGNDLLATGKATWPSGMAQRAEEVAAMADAASGIRWAYPDGSDLRPDPALIARTWANAADTSRREPSPGTTASGRRRGDIVLEGGAGDDVVLGDENENWLQGGSGLNFLAAGDGDDTLLASNYAVDNTNVLVPGTGADDVNGNAGASHTRSVVDYYERTTPITGDLRTGAFDDGDGQPDTVSARGVLGGRGTNSVRDSGYPVLLYGGPGADDLTGGGGNDLVIGGPVGDERSDGDVLDGGGSSDVLMPASGDDVVHGGDSASSGIDYVAYAGRREDVRVDLERQEAGAAGELDRLADIDGAIGGSGNDDLHDSSDLGTTVFQMNMLDGGPGNDELRGGYDNPFSSADTFFGGDGDDRIDATLEEVDSLGDAVSCGAGEDSVTARDNDDVAKDCETVTGP